MMIITKINELARQRADLILAASKFNTEQLNLDEMGDTEIRELLVKQAFPGMKLDNQNDGEIFGMFRVAALRLDINCKKGTQCGGACIPANRTCKKESSDKEKNSDKPKKNGIKTKNSSKKNKSKKESIENSTVLKNLQSQLEPATGGYESYAEGKKGSIKLPDSPPASAITPKNYIKKKQALVDAHTELSKGGKDVTVKDLSRKMGLTLKDTNQIISKMQTQGLIVKKSWAGEDESQATIESPRVTNTLKKKN